MICRNVIENVNISGNGSISIVQSVACGDGIEGSCVTVVRKKNSVASHIDDIVNKISDALAAVV